MNGTDGTAPNEAAHKECLEKLTDDEMQILNSIRAKQMLRMEDTFNLNHFGSDPIDGLAPQLKKGALGLVAKEMNPLSRLEVPVVDLLRQVEETEPISVAA